MWLYETFKSSCSQIINIFKIDCVLAEAVFLVVCNPSMNELWATYTGI